MRVLFIVDKCGDLGNRLFRFARFYSEKPKNIIFVDLTFGQYVYLYSPKDTLYKIIFLLIGFLYFRYYDVIKKYIRHKTCSLDDVVSIEKLIKNQTYATELYQNINRSSRCVHNLSIKSYHFRSTADERYLERIKKIFTLKKKYLREAEELLGNNLCNKTIICVHIRRNDYAHYAGGRYYFDDRVYLKNLVELKRTSKSPHSLKFVLISDEIIQIDNYKSIDPLYFGNKGIGFDQAILQLSDYIIGTFSTFSAWPSFLHQIPMAVISDDQKIIGWGNFKTHNVNYM